MTHFSTLRRNEQQYRLVYEALFWLIHVRKTGNDGLVEKARRRYIRRWNTWAPHSRPYNLFTGERI
jgi:hypothetical protein